MLILATIFFLVGVVLGLRFRMVILVPTVGVAFAMVAFNGVVVGADIWRLVGTMVVVATSVQLGYVAGSILQFVTHATATDAADRFGVSMPSSSEVSPSGRMPNRGGASSRFEANKHLHQA